MYYLITLIIFIFLHFYFKNKKIDNLLFGLSLVNVFLHFIKILFYPYTLSDEKLYYLGLSNLCAVNVLIYPIFLKFKNKYILNYLGVFGCISALLALLLPYELKNRDPFEIENLRYILTHGILLFISLEIIYLKIVKINYIYMFIGYFIFFIEQIVILLNDFIFYKLGIIESMDFLNASFIYGINEKVLNANFAKFLILDIFVVDGKVLPLIYLIYPCFILLLFITLGVGLTLDNRHFLNNWYNIKYKIIRKKRVNY